MSASRFFGVLCLKLILAAAALLMGCQAFAESASGDENGKILPAWTIMAYIDGDNNLEKQLIFNLLEMEQAKPDGIEIIVFMDRSSKRWNGHGGWSGARIYRVRKNADLPPELIASDVYRSFPELVNREVVSELLEELGDVNSADPATIENFIRYAAAGFPARRYAFIGLDHGGGWFGNMHDEQRRTSMLASHLAGAVARGAAALPHGKFDLMIYDMCLMGQLDVVFETAQAADFMVASPPPIPGFGSNYVQILSMFTHDVSTAELSRMIARKNTEFFNGHNMVSDVAAFSAYDLSAVGEVVGDLASLAKKLEAKTAEHSAELTVNTALAHHYEGLGYDDYVRGQNTFSPVSLESWLGRLKNVFPDLKNDIATLQSSLARLIIATYATEDYSAAGGLSIYLPLTESNVRTGYFDTAFAQKSGMGEYLRKLYRKQKELKEASKVPEVTAIEVGNVRVKDGADPEDDRSKLIDKVSYLAPLSGASIRFEVKGENILYSAINQLSVCGDSKTTYLDYSQLVVDLQRQQRLKDDRNHDARDVMPRYADGSNVFVREATGQKYAVVHGQRVHDVTVFHNSLDFGVITVFAVYHDPLQVSDTEVMLEYSDSGLKMSDLKTGRQLAYQSNGTLRFGRVPMERKGNAYVYQMDGDGNLKFEYSDPVPLSAYSLALENLSDDCRVTYAVQASNIWGRQSLSVAPKFLEVRNDPKQLAMMALAKADLKSLYTRYAVGRYARTAGSGLELLPLTQSMELVEKERFTNIGMNFEACGWHGADGTHGFFEILASDSRYVPLTLKMNLADERKKDFVFRNNVSSFQIFQKSSGDSRVLYMVGLGSGTRFALYPMDGQNARALQGTWISDTHKWIFDGDRVVFEYFGDREELRKGRFEGTYRINDNQLILEGDFQPELRNMFFLCDRQDESLRLKGHGPHLFSSRKALSAGNMTLEDFRRKLQGTWRAMRSGSDAAMTVTKIENSDNLLFSFAAGGKKVWGFGKVGDGVIDLLYSTGQSKILNFSYDGRRLKLAPESSNPWVFEKSAAEP